MAVIFKDLVIDVFTKTRKFVNENRILVRFTAFALVAVVSLIVCLVSCGITLGFNVKYQDKIIATVSGKSVFYDAKEVITQNLAGNNREDVIKTPKFALTITLAENLSQSEALADSIIENTDGIEFSSALKVNGEVVAYACRDELKQLVDKKLCKYYIKGAENKSTFVDNVEIEDGYCVSGKIKTTAAVKEVVSDLKVKTVSTVTDETAIKYTTKVIYTKEKTRTYEKVQTKGEKGLKRETKVVETVNGKETASTLVSRKVVKEPVQKVVVKGTAISRAEASALAEAKSAGFIRPMNKGDIKMISAYWGDGRNHKAIDFAGNIGSPLFASKGGTVSFAGWDGNYGYAVVIDHGNGYQTRYAHANALCVRKGETVKQGQQVATLGNTGRSTGPHLHFEILKNGKQVNPAPYIGY